MDRKLNNNPASHTCLCDVARLLPHVLTQILQGFGHLVFLDTDDSHGWGHVADLHTTPTGRGRDRGRHGENNEAPNHLPTEFDW
jgi:hypothetical protein